MEIATANVPEFPGKVYVFPDVSGSMQSAVTGYRQGATTAVRWHRCCGPNRGHSAEKEPGAEVIPFESKVVEVRLNPRDSVVTTLRSWQSCRPVALTAARRWNF